MSKSLYPRMIGSKPVYNGFCDVYEDLLIDQKEQQHTYFRITAKADGIAVLAEIEPERFLLVYEYRYPLKIHVLSCPGGRIDQGEDLLVGAKRELLEETGYTACEWTPMHYFYPFPSVCDQKVHLYLARGLQHTQNPKLDPLERLEIKTMTLTELMLLDCSVCPIDGVLAAALFAYRQLMYRKGNLS